MENLKVSKLRIFDFYFFRKYYEKDLIEGKDFTISKGCIKLKKPLSKKWELIIIHNGNRWMV